MTANAFEEDRQAALRCGMNGHIAKPIDIEKLMETLDDAYLSMDHFNKPSYMEDWFSLINWSRAEERYLSALGAAAVG